MSVEVTMPIGVRSGADVPCLHGGIEPVPHRTHRDEPRERRRREHPGERRHAHPR